MFTILSPASFATRLAAAWALGTEGAIPAAFEAAIAVRREAAIAGDDAAEACGALQASWFAFQMGHVEQGLEHATTAKRIYQALGLPTGEGAAVAMGAWLLLEAGLTAEAAADAERALSLVGPTGDGDIHGFVTNVFGVVLWYSGQPETAIPFCVEAVACADRAGDMVASAWWRVNLAGAHAAIGGRIVGHNQVEGVKEALDEGIRINATALELAVQAGDLWCQALALCNAAEFLCAAGRIDEAMAHLVTCDALPWEPMERSRAHFVTTRAEVLLLQARYDEALALCEDALRCDAMSAIIETRMLLFRHAATAHERRGAFQEALEAFKQFHDAHLRLNFDKAQRHARIAGIRYETDRLREEAEAAQAQVASLVLTSQSDPLTGLANRRVFDSALADLTRTPRPYALAIIDLDHFKRINDRFSHPVGDDVLSQVGAILAQCCPADDLVARIGGEEFMLLMTASDPEAASGLCETLREAIGSFPWKRHHPRLQVTTSIGLARHEEAATPKDVLALADRRLYEAKRLGRNCVVDGSGPLAARYPAQSTAPPSLRARMRRPATAH